MTAFPLETQLKAASGTESADAAFAPLLGQGGQQFDDPVILLFGVRLHQHFANTSGTTEVAVDLEGWVSIH